MSPSSITFFNPSLISALKNNGAPTEKKLPTTPEQPVPQVLQNYLEAQRVHTHVCGKSFSMQTYKNSDNKNPNEVFKCPGCGFSGRSIRVHPCSEELKDVLSYMYNCFIPAYKELDEKNKKLQKASEMSFKIIQALTGYRQAKEDFQNKHYDNAIDACITALKLNCQDTKINTKLKNLLFKAHNERLGDYQKSKDQLEQDYKSKKNSDFDNSYKHYIVNYLNNIGISHKQIADLLYEIDDISDITMEEFKKAADNFKRALNLLSPDIDNNEKQKLLINLINVYDSLAKINTYKNNTSIALKYYKKIINTQKQLSSILKENQDICNQLKVILNDSCLSMSELYLKLSTQSLQQNNIKQCKKYLDKCESWLKKIDEQYVDKDKLAENQNLLSLSKLYLSKFKNR